MAVTTRYAGTRELGLKLDFDAAFERALRQFELAPDNLKRAQKQALNRLNTWLKRQVLREVAKAVGVSQKSFKALLRFYSDRRGPQIQIWVGTDPIDAHNLGVVRWTRRMKGARVGRRLFPGSWSWGYGSRTGTAVMYRVEGVKMKRNPKREAIDKEFVHIHGSVGRAMQALVPKIEARLQDEMRRAIHDQLFREGWIG